MTTDEPLNDFQKHLVKKVARVADERSKSLLVLAGTLVNAVIAGQQSGLDRDEIAALLHRGLVRGQQLG